MTFTPLAGRARPILLLAALASLVLAGAAEAQRAPPSAAAAKPVPPAAAAPRRTAADENIEAGRRAIAMGAAASGAAATATAQAPEAPPPARLSSGDAWRELALAVGGLVVAVLVVSGLALLAPTEHPRQSPVVAGAVLTFFAAFLSLFHTIAMGLFVVAACIVGLLGALSEGPTLARRMARVGLDLAAVAVWGGAFVFFGIAKGDVQAAMAREAWEDAGRLPNVAPDAPRATLEGGGEIRRGRPAEPAPAPQ